MRQVCQLFVLAVFLTWVGSLEKIAFASGESKALKSPALERLSAKELMLNKDLAISSQDDSNSEYFKIIGQLEQLNAQGQRATLVSPDFFQSLSWIGRTACINYVCGILTIDQCRRVLELAHSDDALVVRDHALRITISTSHFTGQEKRAAAERAVSDNRNYRKGRPFWIVDRARGFLVSTDSKNSSTR